MIDYDWKCKQCSHLNSAGVEQCDQCGCSAYASSEEIEARANPDGVALLKSKKRLDKKLIYLTLAPFSIVITAVVGDLVSFALIMSVTVLFIMNNMGFMKFLFADDWAKRSILTYITLTPILLLIRYSVPDGRIESFMTFLTISYICLMSWYVMKSKDSIEFLARYHARFKA